ncbi:hypothetical protein [Paenibacillus sp. yr247]|uniref:hypothetical protein n=1 Tax=Paenibacillus sp. yr247 TaxID=1761880 RepID=UPI000B8455D3|nr:hypothetical protein [Paenibacillus sp. yr247]
MNRYNLNNAFALTLYGGGEDGDGGSGDADNGDKPENPPTPPIPEQIADGKHLFLEDETGPASWSYRLEINRAIQ